MVNWPRLDFSLYDPSSYTGNCIHRWHGQIIEWTLLWARRGHTMRQSATSGGTDGRESWDHDCTRERRPWHSMYSYRVSLCPTWLCCRGPFVPVPFSICLALSSLSLIPRFTAFLHQPHALTLALRRACFYTVLIICFVRRNHRKRSCPCKNRRFAGTYKMELWNSYSMYIIR